MATKNATKAKSATKAKTRKVHVDGLWADALGYEVGERVYVARVSSQTGRRSSTEIRREPFRTNMGNVEVIEGWLGATDNVSRDAIGMGRITAVDTVTTLTEDYGSQWITVELDA